MTFAVGQRVRHKESGNEYVVIEVSDYGYQLRFDGYGERWEADPAPTLRPCFVCGTPTAGEVCEQHKPVVQPVAGGIFADLTAEDVKLAFDWAMNHRLGCVPDDLPETYEARRKRIAAERNPGHGTCSLCGGVILRCPCSTADYAAPYRRHTGADKQQQATGIARAVRGLSQVEHRVGAAKFQP
jgi:hypothetical protein